MCDLTSVYKTQEGTAISGELVKNSLNRKEVWLKLDLDPKYFNPASGFYKYILRLCSSTLPVSLKYRTGCETT